jgi:hypothetical protein
MPALAITVVSFCREARVVGRQNYDVKRDPQGNAQLKTLFYKNYLKTLKNERFSLKCERF